MPQNITALIINTLIIIPFCFFLFNIGRKLLSIQSLSARLDAYKKDPKNASWFEKYFLGWKLWNTWTTEQSIKMIGDRFLTAWYRVCGVFFIILSIGGIVGLAILVIGSI